MRKFLMITGAATIAILAFAQTGGKDLLGNMTKTLNSAPSLSATYMIQQIGGGKKEYTISFAKPNKMRIEKANDLIVCDGTTIVSYDKNSKVYNKRPQTDAELTTMFQDEGLSAWKSFFFARAYDKISSAKSTGVKIRNGISVTGIETTMDPAGHNVVTFFVDSKNVLRQAELVSSDHDGKLTTIMLTKSVVYGDGSSETVGTDELYTFKAPAGSREMTLAELNSDKWYDDLEEAKKVASQTKRLVMIDFYTEW